MAQLDIKVLTDIVREFDGQVTAKGLSSDLGISYSTFARANRTGTWPKSLTYGSVSSMLDDYRDRYFAGDGEALAEFMLAHLRMRDVDAPALEEAIGQGGYDAFVAELLAQVREANPEGAVVRLVPTSCHSEGDPANAVADKSEVDADVVADKPEADVARPASPVPITRSEHVLELIIALPTAIVLLVGILNMSLSDAFVWAANNRLAFLCVSVAIALLPALVGILVDAPLAWHAWRREHPEAPLTWHDFRRVAKYGAPEGVVVGAGRFNLTLPYLAYQPVCNLATVMCCQSLFALTLALPGFAEFFCSHEWIEFLKVAIVVSYYVAWGFLRDQCRRPLTGDPNSEVCENPDNYLPSRVHMWANTFHLVWTVSLVIVGLLSVFAYSVMNYRSMSAPAILAWPYAQTVLFYGFSSLSPYAVRTHATGIGVFAPAVVALSVGFFGLTAVCYLPSVAGTVLCAACVACLAFVIVWVRKAKGGELAEWLAAWQGAGAYPAVVTATIFCLLALGFVTLAFA